MGLEVLAIECPLTFPALLPRIMPYSWRSSCLEWIWGIWCLCRDDGWVLEVHG